MRLSAFRTEAGLFDADAAQVPRAGAGGARELVHVCAASAILDRAYSFLHRVFADVRRKCRSERLDLLLG